MLTTENSKANFRSGVDCLAKINAGWYIYAFRFRFWRKQRENYDLSSYIIPVFLCGLASHISPMCVCACTCTRPIRACPPMRNSRGMLLGSREEEVLGVKAGDLVLQRRLLLQRCAAASGCRPSKAHTGAGAGTLLGGEAGHEAQRKIMGRESTIKSKANLWFVIIVFYRRCCINSCRLHLLCSVV